MICFQRKDGCAMRGSMLKEVLSQHGMKVNELAHRIGVSPQTLYSIVNRDNQKVDFDLMVRICAELGVPVERFCEDIRPPRLPNMREWDMISRYRRLDESGKSLIDTVLEHELKRTEVPPTGSAEDTKIIPLYLTPAAAGYASPAIGEDYEDYEVPASSPADFAVRISGDSMEPFIADGSVVKCKRGAMIYDGDVGLFFVDGDMKCKQYCQDYAGNVYLFSANRKRKDADVTIRASSGLTICCFGKVLLDKSIPLPLD